MNAATTRDVSAVRQIDVQIAASPSPSPDALIAWARAAMAGDGRRLCIRVVDETEARELNGRFSDRVEATNVLSFPAELPEALGDIAVCAAVVAREAKAQNKPMDAHFAHMVVHGVLHLKGMDHATEPQAREMEAAEIEILRAFGFGDPYSAAVDAC
ncbi:MAG: rRNA maturation RNase YbeY [Gammaproteobacteria bacterium]|nr:rRNA maturation RNase YbeY [Gammaproteobacteria bacterium]